MNRLITDTEPEEEQGAMPAETNVQPMPDNFVMSFLKKGFVTTEEATRALPFVLYLAFLGMLYIANRHLAEKSLRDMDKYGKEVKELSWDYKSTKADLAFKSTLTEVAKRADTLGVHVSVDPPQKIFIKETGAAK